MKSIFSGLPRSYIRHRYRILFYSLLVTFCAAPILAALELPEFLVQTFLVINLTVALMAERRLHSSPLIGLTLLLLFFGVAIALIFQLDSYALAVFPFLGVLAIGAVVAAVKSSLRAHKITDETIYAVLSVYLIGGLFMAFVYWSIERFLPGSFITSDSLSNKAFTTATAVYFSFVTLATLGYGDIIPGTELTRGLVIFECVAGQIYLVVTVAHLVSLYRMPEAD